MSKTPSIVSTAVTIILLLVIGAAGMFGLLVMLNGFNDSSGGPALLTSLVCNILGVLFAAVLAWKMPRWLIGRFQWNSALAVTISILTGVFSGWVVSVLSLFIGVIVAETIWSAR